MALFKRGPRTAAELIADLATLADQIGAAEVTLAVREAERKALLADGSDAELDAADSAVLAARQALATRQERRGVLEALRDEASAREAQAAAQERHERARRIRDHAAEALPAQYRKWAEAGAALLAQFAAVRHYVGEANARDGAQCGQIMPLDYELRVRPRRAHTEVETRWEIRDENGRGIYLSDDYARSIDGSAMPARKPEAGWGEINPKTGRPTRLEPTRWEKTVEVQDEPHQRLDPIEQLVPHLPGVAIGDPSYWSDAQYRAACADAAQIAEALLPRGKAKAA
ncbi:MAG TPA: hypothetical protein VM074_07130 [Solimonas sp.]|nr:hypothetical protein [Solimonas sp.]